MEFVVIWFLFGIATSVVMSNKGRSGCGGFALGFILGPFGLIFALIASADHKTIDNNALASGENRKCPYCAEIIKFEARKCRFCGSDLPPMEVLPDEGISKFDPRDF